MRRHKLSFKESKGQALVELALIIPLLLLIVLGGLDMGRVLHSYLVLTSATREGARLGIVGASDNAIRNGVKEVAYTLKLQDDDISITPAQGLRARGTALQVKATTELQLLTPMLNIIVPSPFPLAAQTTMRVE
jgi:Flp pilus assembly protein TadG